jgi:outer membrane lipoprotein SlyB
MKDLYSNTKFARSLSPAARTASANGVGVDRAQNDSYYQEAKVVVSTGTITDGTHTIEVQESDDNSTFTAVADADLQGTEPAIVAADDDKTFEIGYLGRKRYLRVIVTVAGATTGGVYGAGIELGKPRRAPVVRP